MFSGWSGWCKSLNTNSFDHIASSLVVFAPNEIAQLNHYNHACKCSKQNTSFFPQTSIIRAFKIEPVHFRTPSPNIAKNAAPPGLHRSTTMHKVVQSDLSERRYKLPSRMPNMMRSSHT